MDRDARKMRGERPFVFANIRAGKGVAEIAGFIQARAALATRLERTHRLAGLGDASAAYDF